jgi:hypothetical protein
MPWKVQSLMFTKEEFAALASSGQNRGGGRKGKDRIDTLPRPSLPGRGAGIAALAC